MIFRSFLFSIRTASLRHKSLIAGTIICFGVSAMCSDPLVVDGVEELAVLEVDVVEVFEDELVEVLLSFPFASVPLEVAVPLDDVVAPEVELVVLVRSVDLDGVVVFVSDPEFVCPFVIFSEDVDSDTELSF